MKRLDREDFSSLLKRQRIKSRLVRELRFTPEEVTHWDNLEVLSISTRSRREGLLLVEANDLYVLPYELETGLADKLSGRSKPITCDFCLTWQQGAKAGRITFERSSDKHSFTYICCADLQCSLHIRNMTQESRLSRTQLHEDITTDERIIRLKNRLLRILNTLEIKPDATTGNH